jgi:hypothetical protein
VTAYIHVRTNFELVAEALAFLSRSASPVGLTLVHPSPVLDGEDVGFCVTLEDDTCVFEGRGRATTIVDRGPFAAAEERFEIGLTALALDERNTRMFERVLEAKRIDDVPSRPGVSWPPSMLPEDYDSGFVEPPRASLAPPLVPQEEMGFADDPLDRETDIDASTHDDERASQTRVVRADEILRSASVAIEALGLGSEELKLPSDLVARARSLAPALAERGGRRPTSSQVVVHALKLGLAVLEAQIAEDVFSVPD